MSKANQAFRNADEAVSPVIGVILMVAITVVLAAVVFVLVTKLSSNQKEKSPEIGFNKQRDTACTALTGNCGAYYYVTGVDGSAGLWDSFDLTVEGGTGSCTKEDVVNTAGSVSYAPATGATSKVSVGDRINCSTDTLDGATLRVIHIASGTVIYHNQI